MNTVAAGTVGLSIEEKASCIPGAMECIGALDQGTQSTKFTLLDRDLRVIACASRTHRQIYPCSGWCEHDALELLGTTYSLMEETLSSAKAEHGQVVVKSIGIANQRETILVWDAETGLPLYNAIVWLDGRTVKIVEDWIVKYGGVDVFRSTTGLPITTYFSGVKLRWMVDNIREVSAAIERGSARVGTVDSWLVWNMTGGINGGCHLTDVTNASRTLLMDINTCQWSEEMCRICGIPKSCLPSIRSCSEFYGVCAKIKDLPSYEGVSISGVRLAQSLSVQRVFPIAAFRFCQFGPEVWFLTYDLLAAQVAGDQQASCIGHGVFRKGQMKCTYGTSASLVVNTGMSPVVSTHGLVTTPCFQFGRDQPILWALEGTIAIAGAGVTWLNEGMSMIETPEQTEELLRGVDDTDGVVFVPAFTGLYAPRWCSDARGCIMGLSFSSTRRHIVRAFFESIGFHTSEIVEAVKADTFIDELESMKVDGGMSRNEAFLQLVSDVTNISVERVADVEATTVGIAIAAGLGCGFWHSRDRVEELLSSGVKAWHPQWSEIFRSEKRRFWDKAVERSLDWAS